MTRYFWFKTCPMCMGQGRLLIFKNITSNQLYLHCEECEWGWKNPELAHLKSSAFLTLDEDFEAEPAKSSDIQEFKWEKYAINEFDE